MNVKADLQLGNMSRVTDVIYYQMGFFSIFISCERNVLLGGEGGGAGEGVWEGLWIQLKLLKNNFCFIILPLVFTYFITGLRNKKISLSHRKQSHFCVKRLVLTGIQLIEEYKSIVNDLLKTISDKTLYKLHLIKNSPKQTF